MDLERDQRLVILNTVMNLWVTDTGNLTIWLITASQEGILDGFNYSVFK
jgi:hypothetical protein